jgi:hypothetical protein
LVHRFAAQSREPPIVFDEARDRGLIREGVVDEIAPSIGRDHEQDQRPVLAKPDMRSLTPI